MAGIGGTYEELPRDLGLRGEPPATVGPIEARIDYPAYDRIPSGWFELLCADVATAYEGVPFRLYGRPGQRDDGIDMYGRLEDGRYVAWQAKRVEQLQSQTLINAIDAVVNGDAPFPISRLVIVGSFDERDRNLVAALETRTWQSPDLEIELIGRFTLTNTLREHPDIVLRHLGENWRSYLCGDSQGEGAVTTPLGTLATGKLCRVAEAHWRDLGIAPAGCPEANDSGELPFVPRGMSERALAGALGRALSSTGLTMILLQGPPGAGKKRLAWEMLRQRCPDAWLIAPESRATVERVYRPESHATIAATPELPVVVWLPNIELWVGDGVASGFTASHFVSLHDEALDRTIVVIGTVGGKGRSTRSLGSVPDGLERLLSHAAERIDLSYDVDHLDGTALVETVSDAAREEIEKIGIGPYATRLSVLRRFYETESWPEASPAPSGDLKEGLALADALIAWRIAVSDEPVLTPLARQLWECFRMRRDLHSPPTKAAWRQAQRWVAAAPVRDGPLARWVGTREVDLNDIVLEVADQVALVRHLHTCTKLTSSSSIEPLAVAERLSVLIPDLAQHWYRVGVEAGDARAMVNLGASIATSNPDEARKLFEAAANLGEPTALANLGALEAEHDEARAETLFRQAAEADVAVAMTNLARMLTERDPEESHAWLMKAYELREPNALTLLGDRIEGTDREMAATLFRHAANAGQAEAMLRLAILHIPDYPEEAEYWLRRAIGHGEVHAHRVLAGIVVDRDPTQAEWLLRRAIREGDYLASVLLSEVVAEYDEAEALAVLRHADSYGCAEATAQLGFYLDERGDAEGLATLIRAAESGSSRAAFRVGELREHESSEEAMGWFEMAAAAEHPEAMLRVSRAQLNENPGLASSLLRRSAELGEPTARNLLATTLRKQHSDQADAVIDSVIENGNPFSITQLGFMLIEIEDRDTALRVFLAAAALNEAEAAFQAARLLAHSDPIAAFDQLRCAAELGDERARQGVESWFAKYPDGLGLTDASDS